LGVVLTDEPKYLMSNTFFIINNHDMAHEIACHTSLMTAFIPMLCICLRKITINPFILPKQAGISACLINRYSA